MSSMIACGSQASPRARNAQQPHEAAIANATSTRAGAAAESHPGQGGEASEYGPVEFSKLAEGVWLHTSYKSLPDYGLVPSNGLIVRGAGGLVLIDTAWNDAQTEAIMAWAERELGAPIEHLVVTHAHADKMGGVSALHERAVETHALHLTNEAAKDRDLVPTSRTFTLAKGEATVVGGVEVFYPGGGHTEDNVVVYLEQAKVLFGGCLIRPGESASLGNIADANVAHWDAAVENLQRRYGEARHVVPSHGPPGGPQLLDHTITLVRAHRAQPTP